MYLLEHDAKELLATRGVPVPPGVLSDPARQLPELPAGPWIVKAQVPAGGRGKAGGIRKAASEAEILGAIAAMSGMTIAGRPAREFRIEQQVCGAEEAYFSLLLDAQHAAVRVIVAPRGGVDVETNDAARLRSAPCAPDAASIRACTAELAHDLQTPIKNALLAAASGLGEAFCAWECLLLEVNPLFVLADGRWLAGDAKMITDDNALPRQPALAALLERRAGAYPEAHLKLNYGCDYVVVDPEGEIGLLTTGAGLSMMLIDELREAGLRPYNFLDVRTGGLRGDPSRLIHVLNWIAEGPCVKVVLVNIFAGITDLGEFAQLLLAALRSAPRLRAPVVARLVGNGVESARTVLAEAGIAVVTDLERALAQVRQNLQGATA
ncbi:MAG TPA: ATP-grasp domain-containing protein [Burkholderiales bacterium]|nr:ATP-grasp domain-containing protein [Burkholderiales bacterium]